MKDILTERQATVLKCTREYIQQFGRPPTRQELARMMGFKSVNAAEQHLKALARKGAIKLLDGVSRGIQILGDWDDMDMAHDGLPIIGRVAAGQPILAQEHIEDHWKAVTYFRPKADYLLRVQGESMKDVAILDGDLLAVHAQETAEIGQIIVARVGDEVTVKRFRPIDEYIVHLMPENKAIQPIIVDLREQELKIEGLCVGVLRSQLN